MTVTQTPVESVRRIDVSVRPLESAENSSLALVSGFYGTAVAPPGSTIISWQGTDAGGGSLRADEASEEQQPPRDREPPSEEPTEPEPDDSETVEPD
jgi:hypothetical protein